MERHDKGPHRRALFGIGAAALAVGAVAAKAPVARAAPAPQASLLQDFVVVDEGANLALALSPDGRRLAFDLCGILWVMPIGGGEARALTEDIFDIAQPDWSPDGRTIVFQSYRDGTFQIWRIDPDGANLKPLTSGPFDSREPRISPDGTRLAFTSDRGDGYGVYVMDLASGDISTLYDGEGEASEPAWSSDGRKLAYVVNRSRIEVIAHGAAPVVVVDLGRGAMQGGGPGGPSRPIIGAPSFIPESADLVYVRIRNGEAALVGPAGPIATGEDVFPMRAGWLSKTELVYSADGKLWRRDLRTGRRADIPFTAALPIATPNYQKTSRVFDAPGSRPVVGIGSPVLAPDGKSVAFRALNDLWLADTRTGQPRRLTRDSFHKCDPAFSPDGTQLAYACDRDGTLDIWLHDLASGSERRLTRFAGAAASCAWSPDGGSIAFLSQTGAVYVASATTGETRRVHGDLYQPGRPSWGPGGRTLALAALRPVSARFREGLNEILTITVDSGEAKYQPVMPHKSIATRGDDGPAWSPDGKHLAFVFANHLYVAPVDGDGRLSGPPRRLNDEVTDAPSWSGDSTQILYLSLGKLRLVSREGGAPRTVPLRMSWAHPKTQGRTIIKAGRLWDGLSPRVQQNVDLIVDGARIAGVRPQGDVSDANAQIVDARSRMVIPGLVDMHAHHQMQGYGYGDRSGRLWLAFGVTATRAPANPAYHMVEAREAIDSGARLGPKCYGTGEAFDGARIYYNFMRPVSEPGQLALEMMRAEALSYDLIKTYVRLSPELQRETVAWAHRRGLHVTGHYAYPALAFGADGMEHIGATNRLGYSRTASATGRTYRDTHSLFASTRAARTPTLFQAAALLGDDASLLEDPRVKALYPPWELARLQQRADAMRSGDRKEILGALEAAVEEIKSIVREGGRVVNGTDSPIDFNVVSLHLNLRAMVRYGLTPYEALVTSTRACGEYLGEPLGVLSPGAFADLVIVDGNPLSNIDDAAKVAQVMKDGRLHTVQALMAPFANAATADTAAASSFRCEPVSPYWWHDAAYLADAAHACCESHAGGFSRG